MIIASPTVGIYRQKNSLNAGSDYGAICAVLTLSDLSSIRLHLSALELALECPALPLLATTSHQVLWPPGQARPEWHREHGEKSCDTVCMSAMAAGARANLFDERLGGRCLADFLCGALEVPTADAGHLIVSVLAEQGHGHGQLDFIRRPLIGTIAQYRVDRHHVIQQTQLETTACQMRNTEVFGMAVGRS